MREVTSVKRLCSSMPAASARSQPASTAVSLFRKATRRPRASRTPALFPPAKPRFSPSATNLTHGNCERTNPAVPSVEPLSTTIVSGRPPICAATLERQACRYWRPFHVTITTEISGCTGGTGDIAIGLKREPCRALPAESRRAGEAARSQIVAQPFVVHEPDDRLTPGRDVPGIQQHPGAPEYFWNRRLVGSQNRCAAGHGLDERQTESFVERWIHQGERAPVKRVYSIFLNGSQGDDRFRRAGFGSHRAQPLGDTAIDAGEHERHGRRAAEMTARLEQRVNDDREIPPFMQVADVQQEWFEDICRQVERQIRIPGAECPANA